MEKEPELTDFGLGIHEERRTPEEREAKFAEDRQALANNLEQFKVCVEWLHGRMHHERTGSYALKHAVENDLPETYVSNGAFIAALIFWGIPYTKEPDWPNVFVQWRKWRRMCRERGL
jgi:hypothetical protein